MGRMTLEGSIVITSVIFLIMEMNSPSNPLITDICGRVLEIAPEEIPRMDRVYAYVSNSSALSFQLLTSVLVCLYSLMMIVMLQNTQKLGELILMVGQMVNEL